MFGKETERLLTKHPLSGFQLFSFLLVSAVVFFTFGVYNSGSAKRYEMEGVITKITWGCTNRYHKPTITYKDVNGKVKVLCDDSVVLTRKDIKVGDYIVKKKGAYTATVNGREVRFTY
ncbi:hypothetical protein [Leucothrix pacifica]|uniref:Uncharacterized protein n=1 Tax=Leucothrix pacifica TaxID=1247513 RepID=A0A317C7E9_9GAMM|nr:hypothetical protein [Leucothrix pacifica]PWQ92240.1 hypothetical protein DKW60_22180 [Leucothrix pacifica]